MNPHSNPTDAHLRQALRGLAADISADPPPPSAVIYLRAERRSRQLAVARATLPLRIMQTLGLVSAVLMAAWALRESLSANPRHALSSQATTSLLEWSALALLIVLAGCWTMILASRRPLTPH